MVHVQHGDRSDAELVRLAAAGTAPAFAVLLHRHGPAVRSVVDPAKDPTGALIGTFVAAMRELPDVDPDEPVRPWLLELAQHQVKSPAPPADAAGPLDPEEEDEAWAELDVRWPDGRVPRNIPPWVGWTALVVALVALAVLVPYLVLGNGGDDDQDAVLAELVAIPFEQEGEEREPAPELFEDEELEPLPSFEFPEADEEPATAPPPPPPAPEPAAPDPEPVPQPEPEPEPEPDPCPYAEALDADDPACVPPPEEPEEPEEPADEPAQDDADPDEEPAPGDNGEGDS